MRQSPRRVFVFSLFLILGLLTLSCAPAAPVPPPTLKPTPAPTPAPSPAPTPAPAPKKIVEIATPWGPAGSTFATHKTVLSKLLRDHSTWLRSTPVLVAGYPKAVEYWEKGKDKAVYCVPFSTPMMLEYTKGIRTYKEQGPRKDIGLLWIGFQMDYFFVSREGSRFKTMEDIKGSKIGLALPGSASFLFQMQMLEYALGLKPGDYKMINAEPYELVTFMKEGTIDICSYAHIGTKGIPYGYLEDLASSVKLHFIPHTQTMADKINKALGGDVYTLHTIPAGLYRNQTKDVPWLTGPVFITLPLMYSGDIAYELCRIWWDYHDEAIEMSARAGQSDPDSTKDALQKKWYFDWHPGALKYYKERGWIK